MILKTKQYDIFKFRKDNREKISQNHVMKLAGSIISKNLLEYRPITVNKEMEILDGQHRLLAAKRLEVEIYYNVTQDMDLTDIILMNTQKSWGIADYLNYYCLNSNEDYLKLKSFIEKNEMKLKIGLNLAMGQSRTAFDDFKNGRFKFKNETLMGEIDICKQTVEMIKKHKGVSEWANTGKFWKPLLRLVKYFQFDKDKWFKNLDLMIDKVSAKATERGYLITFQDIYNFRNPNRINILEE